MATTSTPRRTLRFDSLADLARELGAIEAAGQAGKLTHTGNWSPGQNLGHIAAFMNYPYDGYPQEIASPPWFIKLVVRFMKRRFISGKMPSGVKIPGVKGGTVGIEDHSLDDGLRMLRAAMDRLGRTTPTMPNPLLGPMTHQEWINLNLRHAELHLSFLTIT